MGRKIKKGIAVGLSLVMMLGTLPVLAKNTDETISASYSDIKLYIGSTRIMLLDAAGEIVEPFIYEGTTYLPLRAVAETLAMEVAWDQASSTVSLVQGGEAKEHAYNSYSPTTGKKMLNIHYRNISVLLNGEKITLKSADGKTIEPFLYNGTTYLPLRAVADAVLVKVDWDEKTNSITLIRPEEIKSESSYDTSAQSDWTSDKARTYGYTLDFESKAAEGYVKIISYAGSETDVLVPAKIDGKTVYLPGNATAGAANVFAKNGQIKYVTFEDGIICESIHNFFLQCKSLIGVFNLPAATGGTNTFNGCENLQFVDGDFSKSTSFSQMFINDKNITTVPEIGENVSQMTKAFMNCKSLTGDIYCNSSKVSKADNAFDGTIQPIVLHVPYPSMSYDTFSASNLPENVKLVKETIQIGYLPPVIHIASFTTIDLYNYAVAPQYLDCTFEWKCDIGTADANKFSITATEELEGEYPISLTLLRDNEVLNTIESKINIVSVKKLSQNMTVVCIGDTYTSRNDWRTRLGRYSQRISFVGTRSSLHEGRSGANAGYYLKNFKYTSDKNGISADNPFFNPETQKFDFGYYKSYSGLSPSAVQIFFESTGAMTVDENVESIKTMVNSIRESSPATKIFIVLPAYLASWSATADLKNFNLIKTMGKEFANGENVYLVPLYLSYDRNLNFDAKNKSYPNLEGYNQWGDCFFGTYAAALR